jgi:hypothetical protein
LPSQISSGIQKNEVAQRQEIFFAGVDKNSRKISNNQYIKRIQRKHMTARDKFHHIVRQALIQEGWTITNDPLQLRYGGAKRQP